MSDVHIIIDKKAEPGLILIKVSGSLDNRTAERFDSWLDDFVNRNGAHCKVHFDFAALELITSRAISTLAYYYDVLSKGGGELYLRNVPMAAFIVFKKLGLNALGWIIES